jgi:hypothetical protein
MVDVPIGPTAGSCGAAAYWSQPVIASDIASDPLWFERKELALAHGLDDLHLVGASLEQHHVELGLLLDDSGGSAGWRVLYDNVVCDTIPLSPGRITLVDLGRPVGGLTSLQAFYANVLCCLAIEHLMERRSPWPRA